MNEDLTYSDFDNICRACVLEKPNMVSISKITMVNIMEVCSRVQIELDDELPQQICNDCLENLETSYHFKQQCEVSQKILRQIWEDKLDDDKLDIKLDFSQKTTPFTSFEDSHSGSVDLNSSIKEENSVHSWLSSDSTGSEESESDNNDDNQDENLKTAHSRILINRTKKMDGSKCNIADLKCNICDKSSPTMLALARHMNTHSETRILTFKCPECGKGFSESGNLKRHLDRHKGNAQYSCNECNKKFYELCALALHMKQKHNAEPVKCNVCALEFYHNLQLEQHERLHTPKMFRCDECGKTFNKAQALERHKFAHSKERPFACELCDKSFKFNFGLTKHKKICHSGPQPREICNVCGKSILRTSLPLHLKSHDKDTLYKCDNCPKQYFCEATLKQHIKRKHTNNGSQYKHLCTICGRKIVSPKELLIHMTSHTGEKLFQCELCEKRYRTSSALLAHVRVVHRDDRPYPCSICSKAFHTKAIMNNHMRTHTGEKPFKCPICSRAFGFKAVLKTHMRSHN